MDFFKSLALFLFTINFCPVINGQEYLKIDYPDLGDTVIKRSTLNGIEFYSIDFYNTHHQLIKSIRKEYNDDHKVGWAERYNSYKSYYIYENSLITESIFFDYRTGQLSKSLYKYNSKGKKIEIKNFSFSARMPFNILQKLRATDFYLNYPKQLPGKGWVLQSKEQRKYVNDTLLSERVFSFYEKSKGFIDYGREVFSYNNKNKLVEYISLSEKKDRSDLKQTFDYDCAGRIEKINYYEDGKYMSEQHFIFLDTIIKEEVRFFSITGRNPYKYILSTKVYNLDRTTNKYYRGDGKEFRLPNEIE
jgi:hypothetical protein